MAEQPGSIRAAVRASLQEEGAVCVGGGLSPREPSFLSSPQKAAGLGHFLDCILYTCSEREFVGQPADPPKPSILCFFLG